MTEVQQNPAVTAAAQTTGQQPTVSHAPAPAQGPSLFIVMLFLLAFMYFTAWRPQRKRNKIHSEMLAALSEGQDVSTVGGLIGRIKRVEKDYVVITLSVGHEAMISKPSIVAVLPKGTHVLL